MERGHRRGRGGGGWRGRGRGNGSHGLVQEPSLEARALFEKVRSLRPSTDGEQLPDVVRWFQGGAWTLSGTERAKTELNATKSRLNDMNLDQWAQHSQRNRLSGQVVRMLRQEVQPEMATVAWAKMFETLVTFLDPEPRGDHRELRSALGEPLPPRPRAWVSAEKAQHFRSLHLCEAPGAFIAATNHFVRTRYPDAQWAWQAVSLNPYYEGNDLGAMIDDDRLIVETLPRWLFGDDNTGDILHASNIRSMWAAVLRDAQKTAATEEAVSVMLPDGVVDLVTADGSVDCALEPNDQEAITAGLHYCETVCALGVLKRGGMLVVKMFTLFEHSSVGLLFLLQQLFADVVVFKPATSKEGNSETYVVGLGFRGIRRDQLARLLAAIDERRDDGGDALFAEADLPPEFLADARQIACYFADQQADAIARNLDLFHHSDPMLRAMVSFDRDWVARHWGHVFCPGRIPPLRRLCPDRMLSFAARGGAGRGGSVQGERSKKDAGTLEERRSMAVSEHLDLEAPLRKRLRDLDDASLRLNPALRRRIDVHGNLSDPSDFSSLEKKNLDVMNLDSKLMNSTLLNEFNETNKTPKIHERNERNSNSILQKQPEEHNQEPFEPQSIHHEQDEQKSFEPFEEEKKEKNLKQLGNPSSLEEEGEGEEEEEKEIQSRSKRYGIGFGAAMMAQMGYEAGEGLGAERQGMIEPLAMEANAMGRGLGFDRVSTAHLAEGAPLDLLVVPDARQLVHWLLRNETTAESRPSLDALDSPEAVLLGRPYPFVRVSRICSFDILKDMRRNANLWLDHPLSSPETLHRVFPRLSAANDPVAADALVLAALRGIPEVQNVLETLAVDDQAWALDLGRGGLRRLAECTGWQARVQAVVDEEDKLLSSSDDAPLRSKNLLLVVGSLDDLQESPTKSALTADEAQDCEVLLHLRPWLEARQALARLAPGGHVLLRLHGCLARLSVGLVALMAPLFDSMALLRSPGYSPTSDAYLLWLQGRKESDELVARVLAILDRACTAESARSPRGFRLLQVVPPAALQGSELELRLRDAVNHLTADRARGLAVLLRRIEASLFASEEDIRRIRDALRNRIAHLNIADSLLGPVT